MLELLDNCSRLTRAAAQLFEDCDELRPIATRNRVARGEYEDLVVQGHHYLVILNNALREICHESQ